MRCWSASLRFRCMGRLMTWRAIDLRGRQERKGRGDDLVTGTNAERHQADEQGIGAAGDRDAMLSTGVDR